MRPRLASTGVKIELVLSFWLWKKLGICLQGKEIFVQTPALSFLLFTCMKHSPDILVLPFLDAQMFPVLVFRQ